MTTRPANDASVTAFTLIEVLLALAICAIVLVAINAVFVTAVRLRERTAANVDQSIPVNQALDILSRDLKGVAGPRGFLPSQQLLHRFYRRSCLRRTKR